MQMIKKIIALFIAGVFVVFATISVFAEDSGEIHQDLSPNTQAAFLYCYDANRVLYSKGGEVILAPGATTKIMTGLIACQMYGSKLDTPVTITAEMLTDITGSTMNLKKGTTLTVKDLIYGTVCGGNNDAAQALAIVCSGSVSAFVEKMNSCAKELYMNNTRYTDPCGLDENTAKTTITDVYHLSRKAAENTLYVEISATPSYVVTPVGESSFTIYNRNALVSQFTAQGYINKNAQGIIAGRADAGFSVVATAQKNGSKYLCIVMGASSDEEEIYSYYTANTLFDYAFRNYSSQKIANKGDQFASIGVDLAAAKNGVADIPCVLAEDIYVFIADNVDKSTLVYKIYVHDDLAKAPIEQGMIVGGVDVYYNGIYLGSSKLVIEQSVEANAILLLLTNARKFILGRFFIVFVFVFVIAIAVYLYIGRMNLKHKKVYKVQYKRFY